MTECLKLDADEEKLTLKVTAENSGATETEFIFFDIANGKFESSGGKRNKNTSPYPAYLNALRKLDNFEKRYATENIKKHAFEKFLHLIHLFTNIPYKSLWERYQQNQSCYCFKEFYRLTMVPFEPALYTVVSNRRFELRNLNFSYDRNDPDVFKKLCKAMQIKHTKKIHKLFVERPLSLLTYLNLRDCGFTDIKLYYRILENIELSDFIDMTEMDALSAFTKKSIKQYGQLATMNALEAELLRQKGIKE